MQILCLRSSPIHQNSTFCKILRWCIHLFMFEKHCFWVWAFNHYIVPLYQKLAHSFSFRNISWLFFSWVRQKQKYNPNTFPLYFSLKGWQQGECYVCMLWRWWAPEAELSVFLLWLLHHLSSIWHLILSTQLRWEIKKLKLSGQGKYELVSLLVIILISSWGRWIL